MKEIPGEILAALLEDEDEDPISSEEIGLNQFENLVLQKIRDFSNQYGNQFCDISPDIYPDFMPVERWMDLLKVYLLAEDKYAALKMWKSPQK